MLIPCGSQNKLLLFLSVCFSCIIRKRTGAGGLLPVEARPLEFVKCCARGHDLGTTVRPGMGFVPLRVPWPDPHMH